VPAALADLLTKARLVLGSVESRFEGGSVLSVEDFLRSAIAVENDVAKLRRLSLLLDDLKRFYFGAQGGAEDDAVVVLTESPLEARLTLVPARPGGRSLEVRQLAEELRARGIVSGVQEAALQAAWECAAQRRETVYSLLVAAGTPPESGEDGSFDFAVRAFDKRLFFEAEEPFFGDLAGMLEEVKAGAVVARVRSGSAGRPGRDIRGNVLSTSTGKPLSVDAGEGVHHAVDERELRALLRGTLVVGEATLDVVPFHVVDGQVSVGQDIAFDGHVVVTGHVSGPVRIQARDVYIAGNADAASIAATGDVWVGGTVEGKAVVEAEGRVCARALRDATVRAVGNVAVGNSILESRVSSGARVVVDPRRGVIEGGEVSGYRGVRTHSLGSSFGLATVVRVGRDDLRTPLLAELEKRIRENEETLRKIAEVKRRLAQRGGSPLDLSAEQLSLYLSALRKEIQGLEELQSLKRRQKKLRPADSSEGAASVAVAGPLHPPVTVEIGEASEVVRERLDGVTLTLGPGRKVVSQKTSAAARK
jgi:hypothetical protein